MSSLGRVRVNCRVTSVFLDPITRTEVRPLRFYDRANYLTNIPLKVYGMTNKICIFQPLLRVFPEISPIVAAITDTPCHNKALMASLKPVHWTRVTRPERNG